MSTAQGTHGILRFAAGGTPIHRETQLTDSADHGLPEPGPLLRNIDGPEELRALPIEKLADLCHEVREYIWDTITRLGGHLAPSLGVVELSVVLHYLYDTPRDRLVWDVGHQGYVHKVLTGRRDALRTIRQYKGISGFLKREESPYDVFGAGHASTAISAGLGFATARDLAGQDHRVVAIVGDGAMTGGLAYEGLNNAGVSGRNFTVVLNDNSMSISPNVGAISSYLTKIISHPLFNRAKGEVWDLTGRLPKKDELRSAARRVEESVKTLFTPGMLFEDLGFRYLGPIDGHDIKGLISVFEKVRDMEGPILVHVLTRKGKGFDVSEADPNKYHGVKPKPPCTLRALLLKSVMLPRTPFQLESFWSVVASSLSTVLPWAKKPSSEIDWRGPVGNSQVTPSARPPGWHDAHELQLPFDAMLRKRWVSTSRGSVPGAVSAATPMPVKNASWPSSSRRRFGSVGLAAVSMRASSTFRVRSITDTSPTRSEAT